MLESERRQTERSESAARSLRADTAIEIVLVKVPDDLLFKRVRDCFGPASRRRLRDKTSRKDDGGVRKSRREKLIRNSHPSLESETMLEL